MVRCGAGALPSREDDGGSWSFGSGLCGAVTVASLGWGGRSDGAGLRRRTRAVMVPALRAKALARFIMVKWRRRLRASFSLLRASFWSCNPPARGLWVKTRSSSWTSDGGSCGRRDLLGGVVSRDTVRRLGRPAARDLLRPVVTNLSEDVRRRGCLPHAKTPALLLVAGGHHSAVVRLLAAFRGAWSCVAVSSAVRDSV